ncbi:hypothetical protein AB0D49_20220 [Streptomyces sp. NPDC048290]|uniref:alpha/beta hydrolase family protein n=1 Tax=Streptomyces sp. NPDC048290 TaxID=3155811 RepID=UPI0034341AD1
MRLATKLLATAVTVVLAAALPAPAAYAAERSGGQRTDEGSIDGAPYRIEMPRRWNGTLVLYSHGYYVADFLPERVALSMHPETERLLLDQGYALAASEYRDRGTGYAVEDGLRDQIALLDHFEDTFGTPRRTLSHGMSQGAAIAGQLAEHHPDRFAGTAGLCSEVDTPGSWNTALDIQFVVRTLLAPDADIDLVRPSGPAEALEDTEALATAVQRARTTDEGRARLALAGAVANLPTWYSAFEPRPTTTEERVLAQSQWTEGAYSWGLGPLGRLDLEARAGGNPSGNTGVDYRRQLAQSSLRGLVRAAYAGTDADLDTDLTALARAGRIAPDPAALAYTERYGLVDGTAPTPTITLHTTGDGGAVSGQVPWWADRAEENGGGDFRSLYLERGGHCTYTAAEEILTLRALDRRVDTGRWEKLTPAKLNARAAAFGPEYQNVLDFGPGGPRPVDPAFVRHTPPQFLRPTR